MIWVGYALDVIAKMTVLNFSTTLLEQVSLLVTPGRSVGTCVFYSLFITTFGSFFLSHVFYHVQRVFPEAAAAAGNKVDHDLGLPSDDSDDDDFNPDVAEDEEVEGCDESSSDESVDASASEEMEASRKDDPYLGLPSEDSEDNDYDPNRADHDNDVAEENSSSDFTSDSEDLADVVKGNTVSKQKNDPASASSSHGLGRVQEATTLVSGKRNIERLDYKKLYDVSYLSWFMVYITDL